VPPRGLITAEILTAIADLGVDVAEATIGNRLAFAASMGEGSTVMETEPAGKGASEITAFADEIVARLPV
jgi:chromosome partitioning protein